jgi:hypothetical protein
MMEVDGKPLKSVLSYESMIWWWLSRTIEAMMHAFCSVFPEREDLSLSRSILSQAKELPRKSYSGSEMK